MKFFVRIFKTPLHHSVEMLTNFLFTSTPSLQYQETSALHVESSVTPHPNPAAFIIHSGLTGKASYVDGWLDTTVHDVAHSKPRVMMLGFRGFPEVQGGIESHAEHLCPQLVDLGCQVEVLVRSRYQPELYHSSWKGVKFTPIWAPKSKVLEAIVHTFLGVLYAAVKRPDILHIHAVGPAIMVPLARLFGIKVVTTHHGPDYDRQKWSNFAKLILKCGELFGMRFSNGRIVISNVIGQIVKSKYSLPSELIVNGVDLPDLDATKQPLQAFGLENCNYILSVSRFVPEKRHLDLIQAFNLAGLSDCKLVLVGSSDHPDAYVDSIRSAAAANPNIVLTGFQKGEALKSLYTHAGLFVLPSSHEGLSIALLEALSYGLPVIASDIPANLEVGLDQSAYYTLGDIVALSQKMQNQIHHQPSAFSKVRTRAWLSKQYDWGNVAEKTLKEYQRVMKMGQMFP